MMFCDMDILSRERHRPGIEIESKAFFMSWKAIYSSLLDDLASSIRLFRNEIGSAVELLGSSQKFCPLRTLCFLSMFASLVLRIFKKSFLVHSKSRMGRALVSI